MSESTHRRMRFVQLRRREPPFTGMAETRCGLHRREGRGPPWGPPRMLGVRPRDQTSERGQMPTWLAAGLWGLLAGGALIIGAGLSYFVRVPRAVIAVVMAFGAGVLISALSFDLMDEAFHRGGFVATAVGFVSGAAVYTLANAILDRHGAKHRKRSGPQHPSEQQ